MSTEETRVRFRLSQETIAIITVGIALAGLQIATVADLRDEARADRAVAQANLAAAQAEAQANRAAAQAEAQADRAAAQADRAVAQADRAAWQTESRQLRDEARADREHFQREILRLTAEHAKLAARGESTQSTPELSTSRS